jgi:undecaprenyl diphosphate synthase
MRISNFMLWQISGAAMYLTERTWPDFDADELDKALAIVADAR